MLAQSRLKFPDPESTPLVDVLKGQFSDYQQTTTAAGRLTYDSSSWRVHDDLLFSLMLAVWYVWRGETVYLPAVNYADARTNPNGLYTRKGRVKRAERATRSTPGNRNPYTVADVDDYSPTPRTKTRWFDNHRYRRKRR